MSGQEEQAQKYHFFWRTGSPFSQWHPSAYTLDDVEYMCAEQGMMHGKALLFEDERTAEKFLEAVSPGNEISRAASEVFQ